MINLTTFELKIEYRISIWWNFFAFKYFFFVALPTASALAFAATSALNDRIKIKRNSW
jgi:hypothetical protein